MSSKLTQKPLTPINYSKSFSKTIFNKKCTSIFIKQKPFPNKSLEKRKDSSILPPNFWKILYSDKAFNLKWLNFGLWRSNLVLLLAFS
jgi:hypothetical protein